MLLQLTSAQAQLNGYITLRARLSRVAPFALSQIRREDQARGGFVDETFKIIVEIGIILIAVSFLAQTIGMLLLFGKVRKLTDMLAALQAKTDPLIEKTGPVIDQMQGTITTVKQAVDKISTQARDTFDKVSVETRAVAAAVSVSSQEIANLARTQAQQIASTIEHTTSTLQRQVDDLDRLLARTHARIEDTTLEVQSAVLDPVREISALLVGVKRTIDVLFARERKTIDKAYQDEEMFI